MLFRIHTRFKHLVMYFFILFVGHPFLSYNNHMLKIFNLRALSYLEGTTTNDSRDEISEFFISGAQQIMNYLKRGSLLQQCVGFEKLKKTYSSSLPSPFFLYHWKLTIDNGGWMYLHDLYIIVFFLDSCYRCGY